MEIYFNEQAHKNIQPHDKNIIAKISDNKISDLLFK